MRRDALETINPNVARLNGYHAGRFETLKCVVLKIIDELIRSKMAFLDGSGYIATVGNWKTDDNGLMFSNESFRAVKSWYHNRDIWKYAFAK